MAGVSLAGIKAHDERTTKLQDENNALRALVLKLESENRAIADALNTRLAALEMHGTKAAKKQRR
jgi:hypothetical protein